MKTELKIPHAVGFCKKCFRTRRSGSAYCGECQNEPERMKFFISDEQFPLLPDVIMHTGFDNKELENIVFTYGDTIYASTKSIADMPFHLVAHELTHVFQQMKLGKDIWWDKYFKSKKFRLSQELEAYRNQYRVAKNKNEADAAFVLERTAKDLSGLLYDNLVEFDKAKKMISED